VPRILGHTGSGYSEQIGAKAISLKTGFCCTFKEDLVEVLVSKVDKRESSH